MSNSVACIEHPRPDGAAMDSTWCGKPVVDWAFTGLDHAALNGLDEGRILACRACLRKAIAALKKGGA